MMGHSVVFFLILALALPIVPAGCLYGKENNLAATSANIGPTEKRLFPPDTDLRLNPDNGTVQYLKGKQLPSELGGPPAKGQSPADRAISFVERYKTIFKLETPHDELHCRSVTTDSLGLTHVRFDQIYQTIPVWGNELNIHLDQTGRVYLVQGRYIPTPVHLHTQPTISAAVAVEKASASLDITQNKAAPDAAELVIFVKAPENVILAYKVPLPGWIYFVDAAGGDIIERITTRQTRRESFVPLKTEDPGR